jgi:hypothetical protein
MPLVIGGIAAASGIMSAIGGASQAKAQAAAAELQQRQQNFQNKWQNDAQNRNLLRQWQAQMEANKQIEAGANRAFARGSLYSRQVFANQASTMSKNTRAATSQFLGAVSSRGMSVDSASARAILRQAAENEHQNSQILRTNWENQQVDLKQQYDNMLAQRNLNKPDQQTLLQGKAVVVDSSSSMLMTGLATSVMGAASAGIGAYRQYGNNNPLFG